MDLLLSLSGSRSAAARAAGVLPATLDRLFDLPGDPLVSGWSGYPLVLLRLDAAHGLFEGEGVSWLSSLSRDPGLEGGLASARSRGIPVRFSSEDLRRAGVSGSTSARWSRAGSVPWPGPWRALDRLSESAVGIGWPELVLGWSGQRRLRVPPAALRAMLEGTSAISVAIGA